MSSFTAPGCASDDAHHGPTSKIFDGSTVSVPAKLELLCQANTQGTSIGGYGIIRLSLHNAPPQLAAFHSTLTPEGLRHFANQCVAMAADLEATAASEAAAALAKAAGK